MILLYLSCTTPVDPKPDIEPTIEIEETVVEEGVSDSQQNNPSRQLKRMSISQVRDSMIQISGKQWADNSESNWDVYSDTLGVADYQSRVETDRSPSVMFQKFLDDAATSTCLQWLQTVDSSFYIIDSNSSVERDDVRNNVVHLRWLIQGKVKDQSIQIVDDYESLFYTVYQRTSSTELSWQSVCVALFTHPDFFMY
jgi:hypothetical protein